MGGTVKGTFDGLREIFPAFNVLFTINNGYFKYPDLPAAVEAVNMDLRASSIGGSLDHTLVSIPTFKMKMAGNPIEAKLALSTPMSDPYLDMFVKGNLDLGNLNKVVPMDESMNIKGLINADFAVQTKMSYIEYEQYDKVKAEGNLGVSNFVYHDAELSPYPIEIQSAQGNFQPEYFDLKQLEIKLGKSDISARGRIDNLISYALKDTTLIGRFTMYSNLLDLNELMNLPEEESLATETTEAEMEYTRLPEKIDFNLDTEIRNVLFSNMEIKNVKGSINLSDQKASMRDVSMQLLGGTMAMNGYYDSKPEKPIADFNLGIENFGLRESFSTFNTVQSLAPVAENAQGSFSTRMSLKSALNKDMSLDLTSLSTTGSLRTIGVILQTEVTQKIGSYLNNDNYKSLNLNNVLIDYEIKDGRLYVNPFDIKTANLSGTVQGSNGLDKSLDYVMNLKLPLSDIKASGLLGQMASKAGLADLIVNIGGTTDKPTVRTSLAGLSENIKSQIIDSVSKVVEQKKEEVKKMAADEVERIMADARQRADKLVADARTQADRLNTEAARTAKTIRDEADAQGKRLLQEAGSNPVQRRIAQEAANKLNREADDKAKKVENEAKQRGDQLIRTAEIQAENIIKEAEARTQIN